MSDEHPSVAASLNTLWGSLTIAGVKHMPRIIFHDLDDWMIVLGLLPWPSKEPMLAGFNLDYARKPANPARQFVDQEIGA